MARRSFIALALVLVAGLVLAAPAYAGGVAVEFDSPPKDIEAGVAFSFGFTIRSAHEDRTPEPGLAPLIRATNPARDEQVEATAKPEGAVGHYAATITFPSEGAWQWQIQPFGKGESYALALPGPLQVRAKGAPAAAASAPARVVDAKGIDSSFDPRELTVPAGTTVRWSMAGKLPHTITAVDGSFASGNLPAGQSYSFTFTQPGTYAYFCEYHGSKDGSGMFARVIVTEAQPAALPKTGGADPAWLGAILIALLAASAGLALRWRRSPGV